MELVQKKKLLIRQTAGRRRSKHHFAEVARFKRKHKKTNEDRDTKCSAIIAIGPRRKGV